MKLTSAQRDRAVGALIGMACGDALGAPYEFQSARINGEPVTMSGGGLWRAGEWTDDTSMAYVIAMVAAKGPEWFFTEGLDEVVEGWVAWAQSGVKDIGNQTRAVLGAVAANPTAAAAFEQSTAFAQSTARAAGNGSLMRTAPVAIALLDDPDRLWVAAQQVSALTHADQSCQEACALWSMAIRTAVVEGTFDGLKAALSRLEPNRREYWQERIDEAEANPPHFFEDQTGWVVGALQAAWSAIVHTEIPALDLRARSYPCQHAERAIEAAVRCGYDTDTVAAIAGMLVGARWGVSGLPLRWQLLLHGYPNATGWDLARLADNIVSGGAKPGTPPDVELIEIQSGWHADVRGELPGLPGLVLGGQSTGRTEDFDAVVSLSRIGTAESRLPHHAHARVRVIDNPDPAENPNLAYVYSQVADLLDEWLAEGKKVLLHCVQAQNRTPSFAVTYLVRHQGMTYSQASALVRSALPFASPNGHLDQIARDFA